MKFFQLLLVIAENYDCLPHYVSSQEIEDQVKKFFKENEISRSLKIKDLSIMEEWIDFEVGDKRVSIKCGKELKIKLV